MLFKILVCYYPLVTVVGVPGGEAVLTLAELDIDEVEPGIVEDTHENRYKLGSAGYKWVQVLSEEQGEEINVPLIRTIDTEEQRRMSLDKRRRKAEILQNPDDAYSEFLSPLELLADAPAPYWVKAVALKYQHTLEARRDVSTHWMPVRCKVIKRDGTRCWNWAGITKMQLEERMCRPHLNALIEHPDKTYVMGAKRKLFEAGGAAADMLEKLLNTSEVDSVRLRAATEILDRIGITAKQEIKSEVTVTHVNASEAVQERLDKLREARNHRIAIAQSAAGEVGGEVVDAEVVEEHDA